MNLKQWNVVRPGEWRLLVMFSSIIGLGMMMGEMTDIVSTAGFIKSIGSADVFWLWMPTLSVSFLVTALVSYLIDRYERRRVVAGFGAFLGIAYLISGILLGVHLAVGGVYGFLYVVVDQQLYLFPVVFWTLANDTYRTVDSKRLFPIIASGASIGSVIGNMAISGLATVFEHQALLVVETLMGFNVVMCAWIVWVTLRLGLPQRRNLMMSKGSSNVKQTLIAGWDFVTSVPAIRHLAVGTVIVSLVGIVFEYHFLQAVNHIQYTTGVETYLGLFKVVIVIVSLMLQWFVIPKLLQRMELKQAFFGYPIVMSLGVIVALVAPSLVGATAAPIMSQIVRSTWDSPVRTTFQGMVADERRGRVSMFLDSYLPIAGAFLGCSMMAVVTGISLAGANWTISIKQLIYLGVAGALMLVALIAVWRMYRVYDESLLNWRFARRKRASVLDGIDL